MGFIFGDLLQTEGERLELQLAAGIFPEDTIFQPGDVFRDCRECPEMVVLAPGTFLLGDLVGDGAIDERPIRDIRIPGKLAVGKFEVSQAEWVSLMGTNPSKMRGATLPVESISWDDAQRFLAKLNAKLGLVTPAEQYRMLSESEWEYAARAGTTTSYPWGNAMVPGHANCGECQNEQKDEGIVSVGSFPPNPWGLHDFNGNVWEWVQDCQNPDHAGMPGDGSARQDGVCTKRILRGGSWYSGEYLVRTPVRHWYDQDGGIPYIGLRIAKPVP